MPQRLCDINGIGGLAILCIIWGALAQEGWDHLSTAKVSGCPPHQPGRGVRTEISEHKQRLDGKRSPSECGPPGAWWVDGPGDSGGP